MTGQVTTPSNIEYMILGYAVAFVIMVLLIGFMAMRSRRMRLEIQTLEALAEEDAEKRKNDEKPKN